MYKNFNLTDKERQQIMEMHQSRGYRQPLTEDNRGSKLIGRTATFYTNQADALAAFKSGKSITTSPGAVLGTITKMANVDNDTVSFHVKTTGGVHDTRSGLSKLLTSEGPVFVFSRQNESFTSDAFPDTTFYSESVKQILVKDFFSTSLASNDSPMNPNNQDSMSA